MRRYLFGGTCLLYVLFGSAFLFAPNLVPGLMGFSIAGGAVMVARSYGGLLVGLGVANGMAMDRPFAEVRLLLIANLIWQPLSTIAIAYSAAIGDVTWLAWVFAGLHAAWGAAFAWALWRPEDA